MFCDDFYDGFTMDSRGGVKYRTILAGVASKSDISGSFTVYYDIQDD